MAPRITLPLWKRANVAVSSMVLSQVKTPDGLRFAAVCRDAFLGIQRFFPAANAVVLSCGLSAPPPLFRFFILW